MVNPFRELYRKCYFERERRNFPILVDIELCNFCNFACSACPTGQGTINRKQGFMTGNIWCIVLKELASHITPVRFVRWGEPTLHPKVYDWIKEASDHHLLTHLTTNGAKLDIDRIYNLDSIKFSLHGHPETQFFARELYKRKIRPYITVSSYGCDFIGETCADEERRETIRDLSKPSKHYIPCPEVFSKLSVNWDGTVSACCGDYDNKMLVGDVKEDSLGRIWHSTKMRYYRKMLEEMRHSELPLCRNCARESYK